MKTRGLGILVVVSLAVVVSLLSISYLSNAAPLFYNNQTSVASGTQYAPGRNYGFQINVTQLNVSTGNVAVWNVTNVTFTFGGVEYRNDTYNSTVSTSCIGSTCYPYGTALNFTLLNSTTGIYWINFTDLRAGIYSFQWNANSTENSTNTASYIGNSTTLQNYNISQNVSTALQLFINSNTTANQNTVVDVGQLINVTAALSSMSYGNATIYIQKDGVPFNNGTTSITNLTYFRPGTYNFTAYFDGTTNYTSKVASYNLTIRGLSSVNGTFFTPSTSLRLNWTNSYASNLTLIANKTLNYSTSLIMVDVYNGTSTNSIIVGNYSQVNSHNTACSIMSRKLVVGTANNGYNTGVMSFNSTNATEVNVSVDNAAECEPGRYTTGTLTFRNLTFPRDNFNASLIIDVPISGVNINLTGVGNFSGSMLAYSTYYHSYFFYTAALPNATGVTINTSWSNSSQNLDLFLFDNAGNLRGEAINATQTNDTLIFSPLPSAPAMWEIRIYGNNSLSEQYYGNIIFTSINATDAATNLTITSINFGTLNASSTNQTNLILRNEGNVSLSTVIETKDIFFIKRFTCETTCIGERNFTFIVPDSSIVNRIKTNVTWIGDGNYTLNLYKPFNETVEVSSINSVATQNFTGAWQERFNETTSITKGVWKLQIKNNTVAVSPYNASVILYLSNASAWLSSNYTTFNFNRSVYNSVINNTNTTLQLNLTAQNDTLDGLYEGYLKYTASNNAALLIPFSVTMRTSTLVVNNTLQSTIITVPSNIGLNRTFSIAANITINNTGSYDLPYWLQNSTNRSLILAGTNKNIGFDYVVSPANSIPANSFGNVNITFNITTVNTNDTTGIYEGYILFNATNNTNLTASAHPYSTFNLTIRVNLTNQLQVNVVDISSFFGNKSTDTNTRNTTIYVQVLLSNGTVDYLNMSNFVKAWLQEGNVTDSNGMIPSSGNLTFDKKESALWTNVAGYYSYAINLSVPANTPGGLYKIHVITNAVLGGNNFTGESNNGTLIVNNAGLYMSNYSTTLTLASNTSSDRIYVNVTNYGPASSNDLASVAFVESCAGYSATAESSSSACGTGTSGANFTDLNIPAHNSSCLLTFKVTGSATASACTGTITTTPSSMWFNGFSVAVTVTGEGGTSTTSTSTSSSTTTTTTSSTTSTTALKYLEITSPGIIQLVQGASNSSSIAVKNVNNTKTQNITLTVENLSQSWVTSITPSRSDLITAGTGTTFTVAFAVPNTTDVKDYTGTLKATSEFASVTSSFTLRVLPSAAKKVEINNTFELIKLNFTKLQNDLASSKQSGVNVTAAEKIFNDTQALISQAETYIKNGDYFSAFQLFDQIKAKIESTRSELSKAGGTDILGLLMKNWIYIVAAAGIAGGAILAYLFWPTKLKYAPSASAPSAQKPKQAVEDVWKQLREKWEDFSKKKKYQYQK